MKIMLSNKSNETHSCTYKVNDGEKGESGQKQKRTKEKDQQKKIAKVESKATILRIFRVDFLAWFCNVDFGMQGFGVYWEVSW